MASEYEVRLKAKIDTTQAKAQLKQLMSGINAPAGGGGGGRASQNVEAAAMSVNITKINRGLTVFASQLERMAEHQGWSGLQKALSESQMAISSGILMYNALGKAGAAASVAISGFTLGLQLASNYLGSVGDLERAANTGYSALQQDDNLDLEQAKALEKSTKTRLTKALIEGNKALEGGHISVREFTESITSATEEYKKAQAAVKQAQAAAAQAAEQEAAQQAESRRIRQSVLDRQQAEDIGNLTDIGTLNEMAAALRGDISREQNTILGGFANPEEMQDAYEALNRNEAVLGLVTAQIDKLNRAEENRLETERRAADEQARQEQMQRDRIASYREYLEDLDFRNDVAAQTDVDVLRSQQSYWQGVAEQARQAIEDGLAEVDGRDSLSVFRDAMSSVELISNRIDSLTDENGDENVESAARLADQLEKNQSGLASIGGSVAGENPVQTLDKTMKEVLRIDQQIEQVVRKFAPAMGITA